MVGSIQGERLANRYRVLRHLADGSSGAVYLAEDVASGQRVAIKVLIPELSFDERTLPHLRSRMQRLLKVPKRHAKAIDHVVDIVDVGVLTNDDLYVVMPCLEGDHLRALVQRRGALSWAQARVPLIQIGRLIADYQREMAAYGLTPVLGSLQASNCYCLRGQAREDSIRIIQSAVDDLIIRRQWREPGDHVRSLARYAAPELGTGEKVDVRADVYSLGVIAFELLTGHLPFDDPNAARLAAMHLMSPVPRPSAVAGDTQTIPDEVEAMILRALAKRAPDRYTSMEAFVEAMTELPGRLVQVTRRARATLPEIPRVEDAPADPSIAVATLVDAAERAAVSGSGRVEEVATDLSQGTATTSAAPSEPDPPRSDTRGAEAAVVDAPAMAPPTLKPATSSPAVDAPATSPSTVDAMPPAVDAPTRSPPAVDAVVVPPAPASPVAAGTTEGAPAGQRGSEPASSTVTSSRVESEVDGESSRPLGSSALADAVASAVATTPPPAQASKTMTGVAIAATATPSVEGRAPDGRSAAGSSAEGSSAEGSSAERPSAARPKPREEVAAASPAGDPTDEIVAPSSAGAGAWVLLTVAVGVVVALTGLGVIDLEKLVGGARPGGGSSTATEQLHQARLAEQRGDALTAYRLASTSYEQSQTLEALEVMGRSACLLGDVDSARWIFRHLPATSQPAIRAVCERTSLRLDP